MKIYTETVGYEWRKWFAWHPVRTEDWKWVWLETVERKWFTPNIPTRPSSWIIYRRLAN